MELYFRGFFISRVSSPETLVFIVFAYDTILPGFTSFITVVTASEPS